jgi:hypothetical protein
MQDSAAHLNGGPSAAIVLMAGYRSLGHHLLEQLGDATMDLEFGLQLGDAAKGRNQLVKGAIPAIRGLACGDAGLASWVLWWFVRWR